MVLFSDLPRPGLGNVLDGVKAASILQYSVPVLARLAAKKRWINDGVSLIQLFQVCR